MVLSPWPNVSDAKCFTASMLTVPFPSRLSLKAEVRSRTSKNLLLPAGPARQLILDKVAEDKSRILVWGMVTEHAGGKPCPQSGMSLLSISQVGELAVYGADGFKWGR